MPRFFRTLAAALPLALLGLAGHAAARLPLDYAKALKLTTLFYEAQRSGASESVLLDRFGRCS